MASHGKPTALKFFEKIQSDFALSSACPAHTLMVTRAALVPLLLLLLLPLSRRTCACAIAHVRRRMCASACAQKHVRRRMRAGACMQAHVQQQLLLALLLQHRGASI